MIINRGEVLALIPARGGSKGVPRKNIKILGGYPLIAYSIAACQQSSIISRVIVSTDDGEIAEVSRKYGGEVPFFRPKDLASDVSADFGFINHAIDWLDTNEGAVPEYIAHIRPTTPLRDFTVVDKALNIFMNSNQYTSLRSAHEAPESPYKWFLKDKNGTFKSLANGIDNEMANLGRNEFPTAYIPDGYIDIVKTEYVKKNGILHGDMMMAFESPSCVEVDSIEEFELLEYQIAKKLYPVFEYLKTNYVTEE